MKVLIVEDDFVSRKMLQKIIASIGDSDVAINGFEALEAFKFAKQERVPYDLVCLDIMMPDMTGIEVLTKIREIEAQDKDADPMRCVKVIMTTALGDKGHIMSAFKGGCEAYIVKPIRPEQLKDKIKELGLL